MVPGGRWTRILLLLFSKLLPRSDLLPEDLLWLLPLPLGAVVDSLLSLAGAGGRWTRILLLLLLRLLPRYSLLSLALSMCWTVLSTGSWLGCNITGSMLPEGKKQWLLFLTLTKSLLPSILPYIVGSLSALDGQHCMGSTGWAALDGQHWMGKSA